MRRGRLVLVALLLAVISVGCAQALAEEAHPPHRERPEAGASAPLPLAAVGGESDRAATDQIAAWIEGVQRAEAERVAEEEARLAAARADAERRVVPQGSGPANGNCAALAAQFGLPEHILWRESRCSLDAYNATGCGGRGCVGAAQLDAGHFATSSPWGGVGACSDLDPASVADQQECTRRLSGDGSNLAPWGG